MIITIDGPAGSGKTTISTLLAQHYSWQYINSGAFYRAITYLALKNSDIQSCGGIFEDKIAHYSKKIIPSIHWIAPNISIHTENTSISLYKELFTVEIDAQVAKVSQSEILRTKINAQIRTICTKGDWIVEGRDAGTQIFPNANLKFYLDASLKIRAQRRNVQYSKNIKTKNPTNNNLVEETLQKRDEIDKNKGKYSLTKLNNSHYIDTSELGIDEILKKVYNIFNINIKCR